jgi:hypothetical protein
MSTLDRRPCTTGLAAAIAGIVTLSLITAPPDVDVAVPRVEVHPVRLAAATTAEISTAAVNTFVRLASAVTPAGLLPTSGTQPAASSQDTTNAAAVPTWIGTIAVRLVIAPFWYLAFPVTIPISAALAVLAEANRPPPVTPQMVFNRAVVIFFSTPFVYAAPGSRITQTIPGTVATTASVGASAAASAATASEGQTKPVVNKFARLITTTLNTGKGQAGAAAPIWRTVTPKRTVAPKHLSSAAQGDAVVGASQVSRNEPSAHPGPQQTADTSRLKGGPVVGKPQISGDETSAHSGPQRTGDTSMTSNLNDAIKHANGTIGKKAQN